MQPDDDRPAPKVPHQIGQDLSTLSLDEIGERIQILQAEIARLEAAAATKSDTRKVADAFFKTS
jgi:uncharacterized small protein (DUF1192 family)